MQCKCLPETQPFYYNCENLQAIRSGQWKLHRPLTDLQVPSGGKTKRSPTCKSRFSTISAKTSWEPRKSPLITPIAFANCRSWPAPHEWNWVRSCSEVRHNAQPFRCTRSLPRLVTKRTGANWNHKRQTPFPLNGRNDTPITTK